jgi:hypothetical protein
MSNRNLKQLKADNYENVTLAELNEVTGKNDPRLGLAERINRSLHLGFDLFLRMYGWHVRMNMAFDDLAPFMLKGSDHVDNWFAQSLGSDVNRIRDAALKRFPARKRLIELAFKSHRRKEYELSVPALLMLSEGIFRDLTGTDIFSKEGPGNRKTPKADTVLKLKQRSTSSSIAHVIEAVTDGSIIGLSFSNLQDTKFPNVLHRNRIIHGYDLTYGSKINSYKALSQFEFVTESVFQAYCNESNNTI